MVQRGINIDAVSKSLDALTKSLRDINIIVHEYDRSWGRISSVTMNSIRLRSCFSDDEASGRLSRHIDSLLGDETCLHSLTMSSCTTESDLEPRDLLTGLPSWKNSMLDYKISDLSSSDNDLNFARYSHKQSTRLSEYNQSLHTIDESLLFLEDDRTDQKDVSFDGNIAEFFSWDDFLNDSQVK